MRSIARFPCGRWTKWAVLAAWLVVFVVAGPLAGKLKGIEKNDPADALPRDAESTRVVDLAKRFTPSDTVPALVVYERGGAASAADQAKVAGDVRRFAGIANIGGRVVGPIPAKDGAAFQVVVITSAGLVLAGTFMALGSLPVVLAAEMGFVVAFGVLLDTFVVRSVLVTALALDVGRRLWWPSGLYRRPDLDLDELEDDRVAALVP
jgi:uncharacterized membrane protein YdfJ with MMPL/SSD domain